MQRLLDRKMGTYSNVTFYALGLKITFIALCIAALALTGCKIDPDDPPSDMDKIQGTWNRRLVGDTIIQYTFAGRSWTRKVSGDNGVSFVNSFKGSFRLYAPNAILIGQPSRWDVGTSAWVGDNPNFQGTYSFTNDTTLVFTGDFTDSVGANAIFIKQ